MSAAYWANKEKWWYNLSHMLRLCLVYKERNYHGYYEDRRTACYRTPQTSNG
jgi:hypothetical protein